MLPRTLCLLNTQTQGNVLRPRYMRERDHEWLRSLLDEHVRFVGRPRAELSERLREPLPVAVAKHKLKLAIHVLERALPGRVEAAVPPHQARFALFSRAAEKGAPRPELLASVAAELGIGSAALEAALFADLRGEQRVRALPDDYSPPRFAFEINSALVAGLLARAAHVRIRAWGNARSLVRGARQNGLVCSVSADAVDDVKPVTLDISGPFVLFRHTAIYRRALAALVPRLSACDGFELSALCALGAGKRLEQVVVRSGDPIVAGAEPEGFERRVEQRFATDFSRRSRDWDLIREPAPVAAKGTLLFADFALVHRRDSSRRWLLEIAGYHTREYLEQKLEIVASAGIERVLVCIDVEKGCSDQAIAENPRLIRFRRVLDPELVLAIIERE